MITPPTGTTPSAEQVFELDDAFFETDPLGYFTARIESLIAYAQGARPTYDSGHGERYAALLRRHPAEVPTATDEARELQVAIDAMSLRQHAAEGVIRLWAAVLATREAEPGTVSVWETLTNGKPSVVEVLKEIAAATPQTGDEHLALLLPAQLIAGYPASPDLQAAVKVLGEWIIHAERLLVRSDIHLAAANNKVKHGLAVRARVDSPMELQPTKPRGNEEDGTMPMSELRTIPVFTAPSVEYLARPPQDESGKHGLELTQLELNVPVLLAEATMLATAYAAIFHAAGARYATVRPELRVTRYPTLPVAPTPEQLLGKRTVGMRWPVTNRPDGGVNGRCAGIGFADGSFVGWQVDFGSARSFTVTDG